MPARVVDPFAFHDPEAIARRQERWAQQAEEEDLDGEDDWDHDCCDEDDEAEWGEDPADWGLGEGERLFEGPDGATPGVPVVRAEPKVGRNDPCPCGSGQRYKTCCPG